MNIDEAIRSAAEFRNAGDISKAAEIYVEILKLHPDHVDSLLMLGVIFAQMKAYDYAIDALSEVMRINVNHEDACYNLGNAYRDTGQADKAFVCYRKVLQLNPRHPDAWINMGVLFRIEGRFDEEIACYREAIGINPEAVAAYYNLGHAFMAKGLFQEAVHCFRRVKEFMPGNPDILLNLGLLLRITQQHDEALVCYQKAVGCDPHNADAHWNYANVLLLQEKYEQGWEEFDWFRHMADRIAKKRNFTQPAWKGEDIAGKTILLFAEEGFGDTLQFVRYSRMVDERGARVLLECQKELTSLLKNIPEITTVLSQGDVLPAFDLQCPLMSLPSVFHTTIETVPGMIPYLSADEEARQRWRRRVAEHGALNVGLVWSGGGLPLRKSCSLDVFLPLVSVPDVIFHSLQKGASADQAKSPPAGMTLIDYADELSDFHETAALIENLDLVISVDTAVAHLAGALGKEVWVLIPFVPDWRWHLEREDCPWYPTMRLFRQSSLDDWKSVVERIVSALRQRVTRHAGR